jgi:hypothetical protein
MLAAVDHEIVGPGSKSAPKRRKTRTAASRRVAEIRGRSYSARESLTT